MKKLLTIFFIFSIGIAIAQEAETKQEPKNELKINALFTIIGMPEFTYERIINEEMAAGVSVAFATEPDIETKFTLTPYYRFYFGKKPAAGFYIEGFGMLNSINIPEYRYYNYDYTSDLYSYTTVKEEKYTDFALGFGIGAKWITKKGIVFELNSGVGRNLINANKNDYYDHTFVGRGGLSVGYRF